MKPLTYLLTLLLVSNICISQTNSTASLIVSGSCDQCKQRIENVSNLKGVFIAEWDLASQVLTVVYDPAEISLSEIKIRIAEYGHDVGDLKANSRTYDALPPCCHYRGDIEEENIAEKNRFIKGVVLEEDKKGNLRPMPLSTIVWMGTNRGAISDSNGVFSIYKAHGCSKILVSNTDYRSVNVKIENEKDFVILLARDKILDEVVTNKEEETGFSVEKLSNDELYLLAIDKLKKDWQSDPVVDTRSTDPLAAARQIQALGVGGIYTNLSVEGLPVHSNLGMNAIAPGWIQSIERVKGVGSVSGGYETINGQMNIELKEPGQMERLFAAAYMNGIGKKDINLGVSQKLNKRWSAALLLHDDWLGKNELDENKDGFRDLPYGNDFSLINRWRYADDKGFSFQFGFKALDENRTGGESIFDPGSERHTTSHYGMGMNTDRYEGFGKLGYSFPQSRYKSVGLEFSIARQHQAAYFGMNEYRGIQQNFYGNLVYQSIIHSAIHQFRTGLSLRVDDMDENLNSSLHQRKETIPGGFFEYSFNPTERFSALVGLRADHNNIYGGFVTPRIHLRYEPFRGTTIRISAGRGQRTANIFAENLGDFASSRTLEIHKIASEKPYGLSPEIAWNKGLMVEQEWKLFGREASATLDFFRTDFRNQVVVDLEKPGELCFYNLQGRSFSNSIETEFRMEPFEHLEMVLAYRYNDVKSTYHEKLLPVPFVAKHRAYLNLEYAKGKWKMGYSLNYTGRKRLPATEENPEQYRFEDFSPSYFMMGGELSRAFGKKQSILVYAGAENWLNTIQEERILSADHPFSPYFDASLVWGPLEGRVFFIGIRYSIK